ncbi:META domain-containing protein [Microbulbifer sp. VTAC004]|uniref:META domain-containing protein n=1 Tax=Microbulbifer TaxID=48073 RepID=UPI00037DCA90|nr:META domain-containing protein [Microbulbifer variabilis]
MSVQDLERHHRPLVVFTIKCRNTYENDIMPRDHLRLQLMIPSLLALLLSGCMSFDAPSEPQPLRHSAWSACNHEWVLSSLKDGEHTYEYLLIWRKFWRERPFFTCDRFGFVRGSGGVNPYLGRFSLESNGALSWSTVPAISRKGRAHPSDELEADYLKALRKARLLEVVGDKLIMSSRDSNTRLEFNRVDEIMR